MKDKKILFIILVVAIIGGVAYFIDLEKIIEERINIDFSIVGKPLKRSLPPDAIEIVLLKNKYKVGEEIFYGIQNKTDEEIAIENDCPGEPLEIYRQEGNVWEHLEGEANIKCSSNGNEIIVGPYELKGSSFLPWQDIIFNSPGKYKIEVEIEGYVNEYEKEFEIVE